MKRWTSNDLLRIANEAYDAQHAKHSTPSPNYSEHEEQAALIRWVRSEGVARWPELETLHAIPNGGHRVPAVARKLKMEGVLASIPDICVPIARGGHHTLYIEMKRPIVKPKKHGRGGVTEEQSAMHARLREQGHRVEVCYGFKEARAVIEAYMSLV